MANPTDVLLQLQAKMDTKYMIKNAEVKDDLEEDLEEDIGNQTSARNATGSGFGSSLANKRYNPGDKDLDVPDVEAVDEPYVTNSAVGPADGDTKASKKVDDGIKVEDIRSMIEQAVSPQADEDQMTPDDPGPSAPGHEDTGEAAPAEG